MSRQPAKSPTTSPPQKKARTHKPGSNDETLSSVDEIGDKLKSIPWMNDPILPFKKWTRPVIVEKVLYLIHICRNIILPMQATKSETSKPDKPSNLYSLFTHYGVENAIFYREPWVQRVQINLFQQPGLKGDTEIETLSKTLNDLYDPNNMKPYMDYFEHTVQTNTKLLDYLQDSSADVVGRSGLPYIMRGTQENQTISHMLYQETGEGVGQRGMLHDIFLESIKEANFNIKQVAKDKRINENQLPEDSWLGPARTPYPLVVPAAQPFMRSGFRVSAVEDMYIVVLTFSKVVLDSDYRVQFKGYPITNKQNVLQLSRIPVVVVTISFDEGEDHLNNIKNWNLTNAYGMKVKIIGLSVSKYIHANPIGMLFLGYNFYKVSCHHKEGDNYKDEAGENFEIMTPNVAFLYHLKDTSPDVEFQFRSPFHFHRSRPETGIATWKDTFSLPTPKDRMRNIKPHRNEPLYWVYS